MSDEFNQGVFDSDKWYAAGESEYDIEAIDCGGSSVDWVGRAPSVFDTTNVNVNETHLILSTEWEPDSSYFPVMEDGEELIDEDCNCRYENYTTGGVISTGNMKYGYVEIRAKAAPTTVSSAFWLIGNHFEIDIFELIGKEGNGTDGSEAGVNHSMPTTIHNWDIGSLEDNGYGESYTLDWDVTEDFHVYGAEWKSNSIVFYADGVEVGSITKEEAGDVWNEDYLHLWMDNEIFSWEGLPTADELPAHFEIDYVRVWQHSSEAPLITFENVWSHEPTNESGDPLVTIEVAQSYLIPMADIEIRIGFHNISELITCNLTFVVANNPDYNLALSAEGDCLLIYYDQRQEGNIQTHGMLTSGDQIIIAEGNNSNMCDGSEDICIDYIVMIYTGTGTILNVWQW